MLLSREQVGKLLIMGLLVFVVGFVYYFVLDDHEYYSDYEKQALVGDEALELCMQSMMPLFGDIMGSKSQLMASMLNEQTKNNNQIYGEAQKKAETALHFQEKMLKHSHISNQHKYAELLIKQEKYLIQYLQEAQKLQSENKNGELMKLFQEFTKNIQQTQKDQIELLKTDAPLRKQIHTIDKKLQEQK